MNMNSYYSRQRFVGALSHFLGGKVLGATLTLLSLVVVARSLETVQYAEYVTVLSVLEVAYPIMTFGLPWVASRYIPEYVQKASPDELKKFLAWMLKIVSLGLLFGGIGLYFAIPQVSAWLGIANSADLAILIAGSF